MLVAGIELCSPDSQSVTCFGQVSSELNQNQSKLFRGCAERTLANVRFWGFGYFLLPWASRWVLGRLVDSAKRANFTPDNQENDNISFRKSKTQNSTKSHVRKGALVGFRAGRCPLPVHVRANLAKPGHGSSKIRFKSLPWERGHHRTHSLAIRTELEVHYAFIGSYGRMRVE